MFRRVGRVVPPAGLALAGALMVAATSTGFARQAATPAAKDVISRHVAALGGEKAYKAIKSMRARGTFTMTAQGISGEFEMSAARPNRMVIKITVPGIGQIESGFDGKVGWSIDPLSGPSVMKGRQLSETADDAFFDATLFGSDHVKDVAVVGNETFDGRKAIKLKVVLNSGGEQMEYFDAETGLQIGSEGSRETPLGITPSTSILRDFRKVQNVVVPHVMVQRTMGIEQILTITGYEFDVVQPAVFELPVQIKALIK